MTIEIPNYPAPKKEDVSIEQSAVERSIAKPDAFMKPASIGKANGRGTNATRIRMSNPNPKGRKKKRDARDVQYF